MKDYESQIRAIKKMCEEDLALALEYLKRPLVVSEKGYWNGVRDMCQGVLDEIVE